MNSIDLDNISNQLKKFAQDRDWDQFHSLKNLAMALSVESSELLEIFQWMTEEKSNQVKSNPDDKVKLEEEVSDIFLYLLRIVDKAEIDLEKVVLAKLKKNAEKYPVEKAKGSSKKYDEL